MASTSTWLPAGNRTSDRAAVADKQPQAEVFPGFVGQLLDQRQPSADPALVPAEQLGDLDLGHAVLADQGMNDPGFFPLLGAPAGLVEPVDGGLGQALVGLEQSRVDGLQARAPARRPAA